MGDFKKSRLTLLPKIYGQLMGNTDITNLKPWLKGPNDFRYKNWLCNTNCQYGLKFISWPCLDSHSETWAHSWVTLRDTFWSTTTTPGLLGRWRPILSLFQTLGTAVNSHSCHGWMDACCSATLPCSWRLGLLWCLHAQRLFPRRTAFFGCKSWFCFFVSGLSS